MCLNKFYVYEHHLLLLTENFQPQVGHLTIADFESVVNTWTLLEESSNWMAFYNRGFYSGASQPHKHIQLVPIHALKDKSLNFPLVPILDQYAKQQEEEEACLVPEYKFKHAFTSLLDIQKYETSPSEYAKQLEAKYKQLLTRLELQQEEFPHLTEKLGDETFIKVICADKQEYEALSDDEKKNAESYTLSLSMSRYPSYNLLFTRNWMTIVPRKLENYQSLSCNSLCFAFSFFARHDVDLNAMKSIGCSKILQEITFEK